MAAKLPNGKPQPQSAYKLLHILNSATYLLRTEWEWNKPAGSSNILGQQTCFCSPVLEGWGSEQKHCSPLPHYCSGWLATFYFLWHFCACCCTRINANSFTDFSGSWPETIIKIPGVTFEELRLKNHSGAHLMFTRLLASSLLGSLFWVLLRQTVETKLHCLSIQSCSWGGWKEDKLSSSLATRHQYKVI